MELNKKNNMELNKKNNMELSNSPISDKLTTFNTKTIFDLNKENKQLISQFLVHTCLMNQSKANQALQDIEEPRLDEIKEHAQITKLNSFTISQALNTEETKSFEVCGLEIEFVKSDGNGNIANKNAT